ncbi:peptidoglycan-binding protein (plasmid) [Pseudoalteromonas sp. SCSIO 43201]|uniref:glycoside hydrolase family 108 protein n=1 Tax=Pseudoalteromonas sp. SCSIO 43201 TaxID=2822842 RepID=UPI00207632D9|nr:N-acetylmuramidase [Pseudoalteromonas sp. SCSIO 43201]USD31171.1 peptidoglycan-binding protein [Pseudoalteromonas sp. SCSIO 43201]
MSDHLRQYQHVFESAFRLLLEFEGGFVDDPDDSGGKTKYGISQNAYPNLDIAALTKAQAKEIYQRDYFEACKAHLMPEKMAVLVFDTAVNMGVRSAIKLLQQAIKTDVDGIIGPNTLRALKQANRVQGDNLFIEYQSLRAKQYAEIIARRPSNGKYAKGWFRRQFKLQQYLSQQVGFAEEAL